MNLLDRVVGFLIGQDEALNALGGGSPKKTISGTIGRAVIAGKWWGRFLAYGVDGLFGAGHCARAATREAGNS